LLKSSALRPNIRDAGFPPVLEEQGAHLSYVGFSAEQVKEKFSSFEHTELDLEHLYQGNVLEFANACGIDHIGRPGQPGFGLLREAKPGANHGGCAVSSALSHHFRLHGNQSHPNRHSGQKTPVGEKPITQLLELNDLLRIAKAINHRGVTRLAKGRILTSKDISGVSAGPTLSLGRPHCRSQKIDDLLTNTGRVVIGS
jgi:hypothetical protein